MITPEIKIYMGGINGVGKSSVCKELLPRLNARYLHGSTLILKALSLDSQDELHKISSEQKGKLAKNLIPRELAKNGSVIFDTHFVVFYPNGKEEVLFYDEYVGLINILVHIKATKEVIFERRQKDRPKRKRDLSLERIVKQQERSLEVARKISSLYNIPLIEIDNSHNSLASATSDIISQLEEIAIK